MKSRLTAVTLGIALLLLGWGTAVAHHSFAAEFDSTKTFKMTGTITEVKWRNPHTFFYVDVKDSQTEKVTNWAMEMGSPNGLMRNGWTRNTMKIGMVVVVEGTMARNGTPLGNARTVSLPNGQRLGAASSAPTAAQ